MDNLMNIAELIKKGGILSNIEGRTPQEIYEKISKLIELPSEMTSERLYNSLCTREEILTTAVGNGIALPHARAPIVKDENEQKICIVYLKTPIDMNAPDERRVYVMFVLLTANTQVHLKVLSSLAGLFRSLEFRKALENHANIDELTAVIKELA